MLIFLNKYRICAISALLSKGLVPAALSLRIADENFLTKIAARNKLSTPVLAVETVASTGHRVGFIMFTGKEPRCDASEGSNKSSSELSLKVDEDSESDNPSIFSPFSIASIIAHNSDILTSRSPLAYSVTSRNHKPLATEPERQMLTNEKTNRTDSLTYLERLKKIHQGTVDGIPN